MSNTNWKVIGTNSGNMSRHRNVNAGKLNYEDGKWKSIYDASGNKKIVHDLSDNVNNQNAVVGIGTSNPFSRLSLGSNPGDGTIGNETTIGQIAAIALHEESNGTNFHGITYITDVSENQDVGGKVNALALHSNTSNENIDLSAAKVYVTDDGVLRIGGKPRTGPAVIDNEYTVYPQVTLDLSGSMQIDGFISFCNLNSAAGQPKDNVANASGTPDIAGTREIPLGAIWVGKKDTATTNVALYIQGAGRKRLELASTAAVAEAAKNGWDISSNPNKFMYNVIEDGGGYASSNITINSADFSTWTPDHVKAVGVDFGKNFLNALSIRGGSLAVSSSDTLGIMHGGIGGLGAKTKPIQAGFTASQLGLSGEITDVSSGVIFAEKQILIGTGSNITTDQVANLRPRALLDISGGTSRPIAGIMIGHGIPQGAAASYHIPRATNSIIIGTIGVSKKIGAADKDVSNSVVMGELNTIDRASTTIVAGNTNKIADSSGSLLLLGFENGNILSTKATNSLIVGWKNNVVDSGQGRSSGGNVIFGKENYYTAGVWEGATAYVGINENNAIFGKSNTIQGTEFSFIQGKDNKTYGKELVVFGDSNTVGATTASPGEQQSDHYVQKCLVHGNTNTILGPSGETPLGTASNRLSNVYMMGHENTINIGQENTNAYNLANWTNLTTEETFVLLGSRTEIRDKVGRDNSGVRFAFGTNVMYDHRLASGNPDACGNVFTIDNMGSVWIAGNLIVDGSQVILRTEYFDVSDAALTLNSADHDPNGGGFHILDTDMAASRGHPPGYHSFTWTGTDATDGEFNTGSADLSTNDLLVLGKLTVNGLIDPTGIIFTYATQPTTAASEGAIYVKSADGKLYFCPENGGAEVSFLTSSGGGTGMTSWTIQGDTNTTSVTEGDTVQVTGSNGITATEATRVVTIEPDYGTAANKICEGNDSRLSDSRKCDNTFDNAGTALTNIGGAASGANSDITSLDGLTTALTVAQGGTGSATAPMIGVVTAANAAAARSVLGGAASGANSDITSLAGLTTALTVAQGGTGSATAPMIGVVTAANAAAARSVLGGAASGANSDITSLAGLTTALTVAQGGTGSATAPMIGVVTAANAAAARTVLGGAASGANSDITSLSGLTTALTVAQGGTGATTLTDGGILLGNTTSAVSALAVTTAGAIVIGDGTTAPTTYNAFSSATGTLNISAGGTGSETAAMIGVVTAADAAAARTVLGGAASGANSDITSLAGLTTALTVAQGGTGSATAAMIGVVTAADAAAARTVLGGAASGANSDITSLAGLTTALTVAQGGTGSATAAMIGVVTAADAAAARTVLGAQAANAGLNTYVLTTKIVDITASSPLGNYIVAPKAGTLTKAYAVIDLDMDGTEAVLTLNVNGGTDIAETITFVLDAFEGDVVSCTPGNDNAINAGQYIYIISDGGSGADGLISANITLEITY